MLLETLREEHTDQAQDALKRWDAHDKKSAGCRGERFS
jgi:hypothetical protein